MRPSAERLTGCSITPVDREFKGTEDAWQWAVDHLKRVYTVHTERDPSATVTLAIELGEVTYP